MRNPIEFQINVSMVKPLSGEQKQLVELGVRNEEDFPQETEKDVTSFTCDYEDIFGYYPSKDADNKSILLVKLVDGELITSPESKEDFDKKMQEARKNHK